MSTRRKSWSAEYVAVYRAAESSRPVEERVCDDPYAAALLPPLFRVMGTSRLLGDLILWLTVERRYPGSIGTVVARVRFIDSCLEQCIDKGLQQLVILGAGYDSRAYRFDRLKQGVRVFELDRPSTQQVKKKRVASILGALPDHVVYVPIDFKEDKLAARLDDAGYDRSSRTLFIWEGVSMYLTPEAVDETLAFVARSSGPGSSVVFDYMFESAIDGTDDPKFLKKLLAYQSKTGEPWTFGLCRETLGDFLSERGLHLLQSETPESLRDAYFKGRSHGRAVFPFWGFVHARVDGGSDREDREGSGLRS